MDLSIAKARFRRSLHFIFAFFFAGDARFLFYLLRVGGLGTLSSFVENSFLFECARDGSGQGAIVEIGSFKGRTTIALAYGSRLRSREKVFAVDPQENQDVKSVFLDNIRKSGVCDFIVPVFKRSEDAVKDFHEPIRLLFIDGCHEYAEVKKDILAWKDLLIDGGILAMHDYLPKNAPHYLEGVFRAVEECIMHDPEFIVEGLIDSILFISKKRSQEQNMKIFERYKRIEKIRSFMKQSLDKTSLKY